MDLDRLYIPTTLTARVNLDCCEIGHNIGKKLEKTLQDRYHGKSLKEGYIKPGSIVLVKKSKGTVRSAHFTGEITFEVTFKAELYIPTIGSIVKARVRSTNKAGILAVADPLQIIVARQGQFNQDLSMFEQYRIGDVVNVKILQFRLEPDYIFAVGKLESLVIEDSEKTFALPQIELNLSQLQINIKFQKAVPEINIDTYGDPEPLNQKKSQIDPWDRPPTFVWRNHIRYFINPFELLANPAYNKESVIKFQHQWDRHQNAWVPTGETEGIPYRPFSRAYYKLREILHDFQVLDQWFNESLNILNLAEGPGGFIQALIDSRGNLESAQTDQFLAITLKKPNEQSYIKDWESDQDAEAYFNIMKGEPNNKKIITTYGSTNTGDLTDPVNIRWLQEQYKPENEAQLITADGGIDAGLGNNYNFQEMLNYKLIYSEIVAALACQREGGTFILKVFDIYTDVTAQFLQLIGCFYNTVHITKPLTSRPANSERYVIAQGFKGFPSDRPKEIYIPALLTGLDTWNNLEQQHRKETQTFTEQEFFVTSIMDTNIDPELQTRVRENNDNFVEKQMKKIDEGLDLIKSKSIINPDVQKNIKTNQRPIAFKWCQEYLAINHCNVGITIDTRPIPGLLSEKAIIVGGTGVPAKTSKKTVKIVKQK